MEISEETRKQLNELLYKSFDCNAQADNFAYNLDYMRYPNIAAIYHESYAHVFPQLADEISSLMIKVNARPVRKATHEYSEEYTDIVSLFADNDRMTEDYRRAIRKVIDVAEDNDDYEVKIAMEEFLVDFLPYVKQSDVWRYKAEEYKNSPRQFNVHFKTITTFIPVVGASDEDDD